MQLISRDLAGGIAATAIGAAYLALASQLRSSMLDDTVGPDGLPRAYGWLMMGLGLLLIGAALLRQWRNTTRQENTDNESTKTADDLSRRVVRAAGLLMFGIAYVLLVETLGYPVAIALLLIGVALYMGERIGVRVVLIGLGGAMSLWLMFSQLLGVAMPLGLFRL